MSLVKTTLGLAAALSLAAATTAATVDEGMWLFTRPPAEHLEERYGFKATPEWLEHVQRSCVRVSTGGSGSIVSPNGLVMTNHHVARSVLNELSTPERNLLEDGFLARTPADELECPGLELDVLQSIEDVTARVMGAAEGLSAAEASAARRAEIGAIESENNAATGLHCEVVTLYQGARYHLYRYERHTDVRLVMAPESSIAAFGGDVDNFEYPRWCLDMTFFRIWKDGAPAQSEHHLPFSPNGSKAGELVFVTGHPGRTERLNTVAHLEYLRDVRHPNVLGRLWRMEVKLQNFAARNAANALASNSDLLGVQNSRKAYTGMLGGLLDPGLMGDKRSAEDVLRQAVESNPEWKAQWGDAWEKVAAAEAVATELYPRYVALGGSRMSMGSSLAAAAVGVVRHATETAKPTGERLGEYRDSALEGFRKGLLTPLPIHEAYEIEQLAQALSYMAEMLGGDDPVVVAALAGKSPSVRAAELVSGTSLADLSAREALLEGGQAAIEASDDPLIALVRALDPEARAMRKRWEDEVSSVEREAYAQISAAKFAVQGESVYPDATFTLRLAFGPVQGYSEGGQEREPYTTTAGLWQRHEERGAVEPFHLPQRWLDKKDALDPNTPFNFVATPDIIGGNSGSPTINAKGEVVGLIFDGNIQSLTGNFAYTDEQARATSVDSRIILESLEKVYEANELVSELAPGP